MASFSDPGENCCQTSHQIIQIRQEIQKLLTHQKFIFHLHINWKGCPSPTFYILWGSEFITYLPQCLLQTQSTETAVQNICDEILQNAEHNKGTDDLSTAFDTVNNTILKTVKEHYFGLKDTALQWLSSYVSDRQFSVQIGNSFW